jgi:DMSO reductase anchor subunit
VSPAPLPRVELLGPAPQGLWGWPAVLNFVLGGLGAGLYLTAAVAASVAPAPGLRLAAWLGPALVVAGFVAVAVEAGRPLRGARVLARVRTSWMSRELVLGGAFALLAVLDWRSAAALAAAALAGAQGAILRRARGVAAWDSAWLPWVFLSSALVSGAGAFLALEGLAGRPPEARGFAAVLVLLVVHALVWQGYLAASDEPAFRTATEPLRSGRTRALAIGAGYLGPALLIAPALAWPGLAAPAAVGVGSLMVASQVAVKAALVLRAGLLRPVTIGHLGPQRRAS